MIKIIFGIVCFIAAVGVLTSAAASPLQQRILVRRQAAAESAPERADDLEDGSEKDDLKGSASYGYGYYGLPLGYGGYGGFGGYGGYGGLYSGYPYSYSHGLGGGYYGGYYPYSGGYGFGHYF